MIAAIGGYFSRLGREFGEGWTRFWFTPSDPATLGLIRLLTGLLVVYLHVTLGLDLVAFFGPDGLLPVGDITMLEGGSFSYLNFVSTPGELWAVHLLGLAVLVAFAIGYKSRITSILALVVFLSDVLRAPVITGRTEVIAAMVMLYLCVGPCGATFSLDRLLANRNRDARLTDIESLSTTATIEIRLIQVHFALLVGMMGFSMLAGDSWWTGMGAWWLMGRADSRLLDLTFLHASPKIIELITHGLVLFHVAFPVLIWVPIARPLLLVLGAVVWGLLALLTGEITFALMMVIASLAFVGPQVIRACCPRGSAA